MTRKKINPLIIILIVALVLLAILAIVIYAMGYRYIQTDTGSKYFGRVADGQPVAGSVTYADGTKSELVKEQNSANGKIIYENGDVYEGEIKGLSKEGRGTHTVASTGEVYEGEFKNDMRNGTGTIQYTDGSFYTGNFVNNSMEGTGVFTYSDGSVYTGTLSNNTRNGPGVYEQPDGSVYIGNYEDGLRSGTGEVTVTLPNGDTYTGKNKQIFSNGDVYIGDFVQDRRTGKGIYLWAGGDRYEGDFVDGVMQGRGTYTSANSLTPYEGYFENNKKVVKDDFSAGDNLEADEPAA